MALEAARDLQPEAANQYPLAARMASARRGLNRPDELRAWKTLELKKLRSLAPLGVHVVAEELGRSPAAVKWQAHKARISLRVPGERRGKILHQPNDVSLRGSKLRADVLAGDVDQSRIARLATAPSMKKPLCPACGLDPVEVEISGFCIACHLKELAAGHRSELRRIDAQRDLDAARQQKHRELSEPR